MTNGTAIADDSNCPHCESRERVFLFQLAADKVVRCKYCDLTYSISPPVEGTSFYDSGYFTGQSGETGYQNYQVEYLSHSETFLRRLRNSEAKLGGKGRLLDYGCAYGHLGHVAAREGWDVVATDISYEAVHRAVHDYGLAGFVSDLSRPPLKKHAFDLVTLFDVIEHVRAPKGIISTLNSLLSSQGLLHVTTPDVDSVSAHLLGAKWYHYKPQEHLLYFNRKTLRSLLESCGMQVTEMRSAPSHMTIHDILIRLRRYSNFGAKLMLSIAKFLAVENRVVKIHIGEMQAWAKSTTNTAASKPVLKSEAHSKSVVGRLLPLLACPVCACDLAANKDESQLSCAGCREIYEVRKQIPILLPNAVPVRKAA